MQIPQTLLYAYIDEVGKHIAENYDKKIAEAKAEEDYEKLIRLTSEKRGSEGVVCDIMRGYLLNANEGEAAQLAENYVNSRRASRKKG